MSPLSPPFVKFPCICWISRQIILCFHNIPYSWKDTVLLNHRATTLFFFSSFLRTVLCPNAWHQLDLPIMRFPAVALWSEFQADWCTDSLFAPFLSSASTARSFPWPDFLCAATLQRHHLKEPWRHDGFSFPPGGLCYSLLMDVSAQALGNFEK